MISLGIFGSARRTATASPTLVNTTLLGTTAAAGVVGADSAGTFGTTIRCNKAGDITAIRFWKPTTMSGTITVGLYTQTGASTPVTAGTTTVTNGSPAAWVEVPVSPVTVAAGDIFIVAYHSPTGAYQKLVSYFDTLHTSADGALTAPAMTMVTYGNGLYVYGAALARPTATYQSGLYYADFVLRYDNTATHTISTRFGDNHVLPASDSGAFTIGTLITCGVSGNVTALRYYEEPTMAGATKLRLYVDGSTTPVREVTDTAVDGRSGWRTVAITPYAVISGQVVLSARTTTPTGPFFSKLTTPLTPNADGRLTVPAASTVWNGNTGFGRYANGDAFPATSSTQEYMNDLVLTATAGAVGYAQTVLSDSPVGYWRMEEMSGTTASDVSGHGHHGTYGGAVTLGSSGRVDSGATFDAGGIVTVPGSGGWIPMDNYTLEAWVYLTSTSQFATFMRRENHFIFRVENFPNLSFTTWNDANGITVQQRSSSITLNTWRHIVVTKAGSVAKYYVDGVETALSGTVAATRTVDPGTDLRFAFAGGSENYFGRLDEMAVYGSVLTPDRITAHYAAGVAAYSSISSNPPVTSSVEPQTGAIVLGTKFRVSAADCSLAGFKFYQNGLSDWGRSPTAVLYAAGNSTPLTSPVTVPAEVVPVSASTYWSATYLPQKAIDGSTATYWVASSGPTVAAPQWLRLDGVGAVTATEYKVSAHTNTTYGPQDWTLQGSADGTTWTVLDTRAGIVMSDVTQTFTFANTTAYPLYRLHITKTGGELGSVWVSEFSVTGLTVKTVTPGWRIGTLPTPYPLTQGVDYVAALLFPDKWPGAHPAFPADLVNGPLTVPKAGNHLYTYSSTLVLPTSSGGYNYGLDVLVKAAVPTLSDAFTRTNSTTTLGTADSGQPWTTTGTWGITSNRAYQVSGGSAAPALLDAGVADGTLAVAVYSGAWSLHTRSNGTSAYRIEASGTDAGARLLYLERYVYGGATTPLTSASTVIPLGATVSLSTTETGTSCTITVKVNGTTIYTYDDTAADRPAGTKHGIGSADAGAQYDDLVFTR